MTPAMARPTSTQRSPSAARRTNPGAGAFSRAARAFTLIELMITISVLLIVLLAVMPSMSMGGRTRLVAAAIALASDLEYARSVSISEPADPAVVRFDPEGAGYWLARASDPEQPITRPNGEPYQVIFGVGDANLLHDVVIALAGAPEDGGAVYFDAFGRRVPAVDANINLGNESGEILVRVVAATGDVVID